MFQVIVRFLSYRVREKVYSAKKGLKGNPDNIFITENLTQYRTGLVKTLSELKFQGDIATYWTIDGRIYVKKSDSSRKKLIRNHDDIRDLVRYREANDRPESSNDVHSNEDANALDGQNYS